MRRLEDSVFRLIPGPRSLARYGCLKPFPSRGRNWREDGHRLDSSSARGRGCSCSIATTRLPIGSSSCRCMTVVQPRRRDPLPAKKTWSRNWSPNSSALSRTPWTESNSLEQIRSLRHPPAEPLIRRSLVRIQPGALILTVVKSSQGEVVQRRHGRCPVRVVSDLTVALFSGAPGGRLRGVRCHRDGGRGPS